MGISFGSVGAAGGGVGCHPACHQATSSCRMSAHQVRGSSSSRCRAGHRSAQVTDQRHRESERFIVTIRTSQEKLGGSYLTKHCTMTIHCEGDKRTNVDEGVESAILVRLEDGGHGA